MTTPHKPFGELSDAEKGALLLAHHEGKRIEFFNDFNQWVTPDGGPSWISHRTYRIAPEPKVPDTINWEHVAPEYNFMARDEDGEAFVYNGRPERSSNMWSYGLAEDHGSCDAFASYRRGTVGWQDSLVIRPGYEGK